MEARAAIKRITESSSLLKREVDSSPNYLISTFYELSLSLKLLQLFAKLEYLSVNIEAFSAGVATLSKR
jgi:hypothetical protein